jgi:chromosome transmission fidelity protein 1
VEEKSDLKAVDTFSCSHIIPSSHISSYAVRAGPSNVSLDFRHGNKEKDQLIRELFWSVNNLCSVVPHGVVLFFTSYAYMDFVHAAWKRMLLTPQLGAIKHICVEQRRASAPDSSEGSSDASKLKTTDHGEDAWGKYIRCVRESTTGASRKGALLMSVMGGRLSEGINFSDDLARAVVIVGMPYPDLSDPVLKEKLSFAERAKKGSSRVIYEGMCMKSVNQSIGRAIRHINDYACVVLLDSRYTQPRVKSQLPSWILRSNDDVDECGGRDSIFHSHGPFQETVNSIKKFFASK